MEVSSTTSPPDVFFRFKFSITLVWQPAFGFYEVISFLSIGCGSRGTGCSEGCPFIPCIGLRNPLEKGWEFWVFWVSFCLLFLINKRGKTEVPLLLLMGGYRKLLAYRYSCFSSKSCLPSVDMLIGSSLLPMRYSIISK